MLFNGAPGLLAMAIERLALEPGQRVFHLGPGMKLVPVLQCCRGFRADHGVCEGG